MIVKWTRAGLVTAMASLASTVACAEMRFNLQPPQTAVAREVYDLHMVILWICVAIFVGVFAVMLYSIVKHRKSVGHQAVHFHENTSVEIAWTVIPFVILVAMAVPATKALLAMRDTSAPEMTVKVTGYQWRWGYEYLLGEGEGIRFLSALATPRDQIEGRAPKGTNYLLEVDNPMVVPVGKKVRLLITSQDVIHSWWVPAFAIKQDANPGFIRDAWFRADKEGTYRGQCVELCGKEHAFMPIVVEVVSPEKYAQWVAGQKQKMAAATAASGPVDGKAVYDKVCQVCHASGVAAAPKYGDKSAWAPRIKEGQDALYDHALKGIRGMPPKGGSPDLSDAQVKAAVDYIVAAGK
jgi:cytochrome c oxidase subunit 2